MGYVGEVTQADLDNSRYANARLGTVVGRSGLEQEYDDTLRGIPGVRYIEVDARGRLVREQGAAPPLPPVAGRSLRTTIDLPLQLFIDSIWPPGISGAMIAMTPDGQIRALYSTPSYDPNSFVGGISSSEWRSLNTDPTLPLLNRALQVRYPPGSPFKLATAAMALERGLVDLHTHMPVPCRGGMQYGNRYFKCWNRTGHGSLDLVGAIAQSCDVYFYQLGLRLQLHALLEDGVKMGFRDRTGIDLVNEVTPIYPGSTAYYDKTYGPRGWSNAVILNLSIGQGENTQTLINMLKFYGALAGARQDRDPLPGAPRFRGHVRSGTHAMTQLEGLRTALIAVVERGTAARSRLADLQVAGKTGTAQNPHGKDHGWFIGFAPAEKPEIVVGAIFEFGEHGTVVAPYVVRAISRYLLGPDSTAKPIIRVIAPDDSAPREVEVRPAPVAPADSLLLAPCPPSAAPMRSLGPDRPLLIVTALLLLFGLLMLYSAGQTDVPVVAAGGSLETPADLARSGSGSRGAGVPLVSPAARMGCAAALHLLSGPSRGHPGHRTRGRHRREQQELDLHRRACGRTARRAGQDRGRADAGALPLRPARGAFQPS